MPAISVTNSFIRPVARLAGWVCVSTVAAFGADATSVAPAIQVVVAADEPGPAISSTLYGVFFEDINFGADGGLYAELVKNRTFSFPDALQGWQPARTPESGDTMRAGDASPLDARHPHYLSLTADRAGFGVRNEGFRGMGVTRGETYDLEVSARAAAGAGPKWHAELVSPEGALLCQASLVGAPRDWQRFRASLRPSRTEAKAALRIVLDQPGAVDLALVSLFPRHTWRNRPGGLRADLVQMLADLKPGFVRFPGGCIVEGRYLSTRYQWKNTIGDPLARPLLINRWNDEFKHRPTPDYYQTFGLGFMEYFQVCEDIGAEPLPILNCGMACQFNSNELAPLEKLDPYIQDALDLIEFANGPVTTTWGRKRAELGHPAPFHLKILGVGNEQWGPQYLERYEPFARALKASHPEVRLVTSAGPSPDGDRYDFLWGKLRALNADIVDEHCYAAPSWFFTNATRYDRFARTGPKVFMGEYAAQSVAVVSPENRNNWGCALAEAAFMTGLERNADVVVMSSYAPLFAHADAWQWRPNLIWFDNLRVVGTPNYQVQRLFSRNHGTRVLPVRVNGSAQNGAEQLYLCASRDDASGEIILKLVNPRPQPTNLSLEVTGPSLPRQRASLTVLANADLAAENDLTGLPRVAPVQSRLEVGGNRFTCALAPNSVTALRLAGR